MSDRQTDIDIKESAKITYELANNIGDIFKFGQINAIAPKKKSLIFAMPFI